MSANVPIHTVYSIFKMAKYRDGNVQTRQFFTWHRIESCVLQCTEKITQFRVYNQGFLKNVIFYLVIAYSRRPWCKCISLKVPIHPRSFLSLPIFQVTNNGLKRNGINSQCLNITIIRILTRNHWWKGGPWAGPFETDDSTRHRNSSNTSQAWLKWQ